MLASTPTTRIPIDPGPILVVGDTICDHDV
jgi:hypothetical protein